MLTGIIVKPQANAACPHYVPLGIVRVKVVWTVLFESCDIATQRKQAISRKKDCAGGARRARAGAAGAGDGLVRAAR